MSPNNSLASIPSRLPRVPGGSFAQWKVIHQRGRAALGFVGDINLVGYGIDRHRVGNAAVIEDSDESIGGAIDYGDCSIVLVSGIDLVIEGI